MKQRGWKSDSQVGWTELRRALIISQRDLLSYNRSTRQFHVHPLRDHPSKRQYSIGNSKSILLLMVAMEKECP